MDYSMLLLVLLGCPLAAALLIAVLPAKSTPRGAYETLHVLSLAGVAVAGLTLVVAAFAGSDIFALGEWFHLDGLSALFLGLIAVIAPCTGVYSLPYVAHDVAEGKLGPSQVKQYYAFFSLFVFSMILAVTSNNIIMMWVSVEATTLSTVFLVGVYRTKLALEAAWKYVIVCTAGVAFGLFGTLLVYANAADIMADPHQAVFWTAILPNAPFMDRSLMMIAFVFAAIGFGTKAGLFPMHTWLPDAHSEAPSPVSALLSGVLLKCAILIVLRFYILTAANVGATFPQTVMMILGVLSVCYAAFEVYKQNDLKRKLAYSSCENVGLIAVCFGIGGPLGHHRRARALRCPRPHQGPHVLPVRQCDDEVPHARPREDLGHHFGGAGDRRAVRGRLPGFGGLPSLCHVRQRDVHGSRRRGRGSLVGRGACARGARGGDYGARAHDHRIGAGRVPEGVKRGDVPALALVPEVVLLALVVLLGVGAAGALGRLH